MLSDSVNDLGINSSLLRIRESNQVASVRSGYLIQGDNNLFDLAEPGEEGKARGISISVFDIESHRGELSSDFGDSGNSKALCESLRRAVEEEGVGLRVESEECVRGKCPNSQFASSHRLISGW